MRLLRAIALFVSIFLVSACIDRVFFEIDSLNNGVLVIDGQITDQPGPYSVKLLRASNADDLLNFASPFIVENVTIFDDVGNSENLSSDGDGIYKTKPNGIRGVVGRRYKVRIELLDGTSIESIPDELRPVGEIDSVFYRFEATDPLAGPTEYKFRIFANSHVSKNQGTDYVRWRFTGTYKVLTYPELHLINDVCIGPKDPLPCSGYILSGGILKYNSECSCCYCWVSDYENKPKLNDDKISTNGTFKNLEVGIVPFDKWTFSQNKYMVKIEQMSLTYQAYQYWKIVRDQKEGVSSLFQPSFGSIKTNLVSSNSNLKTIGIFYASSVNKRVFFIKSSDAPISVPAPDILPEETCAFWDSCDDVFFHAFRTPPPEWK